MDFVTITDHDTIDGVIQIADRPDVFVSEELTASFRGEPARRCTCSATTSRPTITIGCRPTPHDVELCAAYMYEREIACALAHPYYTVDRPLDHAPPPPPGGAVRRLGDPQRLARARAEPARRDVRRHARDIGIGGSDDHAGVDIGRTYTESPLAAHAAGVPCAHARRARPRARQAGQRRQVGARGDRPGRALARARRDRATGGHAPDATGVAPRTRARCVGTTGQSRADGACVGAPRGRRTPGRQPARQRRRVHAPRGRRPLPAARAGWPRSSSTTSTSAA